MPHIRQCVWLSSTLTVLPHRSVLYFAPANDDHVKQFLLEALMNECELEDRDVITLVIAEDGFTEPSWLKEEFDLKMLAALYEVKAGQHTAILLGKDGEEKHRWGAKTDWQFINDLIDENANAKKRDATENAVLARSNA